MDERASGVRAFAHECAIGSIDFAKTWTRPSAFSTPKASIEGAQMVRRLAASIYGHVDRAPCFSLDICEAANPDLLREDFDPWQAQPQSSSVSICGGVGCVPPTDMFLEPFAPVGTSARGDAQFRSWKARSNCRAAAMPPPCPCAEAIPISFSYHTSIPWRGHPCRKCA